MKSCRFVYQHKVYNFAGTILDEGGAPSLQLKGHHHPGTVWVGISCSGQMLLPIDPRAKALLAELMLGGRGTI